MNLIHRLAFRYSGNILAKALVRPIYRMFVACKLNQKKECFVEMLSFCWKSLRRL